MTAFRFHTASGGPANLRGPGWTSIQSSQGRSKWRWGPVCPQPSAPSVRSTAPPPGSCPRPSFPAVKQKPWFQTREGPGERTAEGVPGHISSESLSCEAVSRVRAGVSQIDRELREATTHAAWVLSHQDAFHRENPDPGNLGTWDRTYFSPFVLLQNSQVLVGHRHHLLEHSAPASPGNQPAPARLTSCLTFDSRD